MKEGIIHRVKHTERMALLLVRRKDQNLTESQGLTRRVEGVCEDIEQTVAYKHRVRFHSRVESEHQPAMRRVGNDHNLTSSIDKPIRKGLNLCVK